MCQVSHQRTYQKKLVSDKYVITMVCPCGKLKEVDPTWSNCPFCGEAITITDLQDIVEES